jgi:hypothetical protein
MFPRAAVSLYPVNKFGTGKAFRRIFGEKMLAFDGFFREPEKCGQGAKTKKAGVKAGLLQFAVESAQ